MHFQNSVEPNKMHGAFLLSTVKKCFNIVHLVIAEGKFLSETFSGNEERDVKASVVNGTFSKCKLRATLYGESELKAC